MKKELGTSGVMVSPIIMGCWGIGGGYTWGDQDEKESIDTIRAALDCGINTFDTAEFYSDGYSEEVLGKGLGSDRSNTVITSKIFTTHLTADKVAGAVEGSLKRLNTDYIDLMQIHWLDPEIKVEETLRAMEDLKDSGKIRTIGVCNHGTQQMADAMKASEIVTNQVAYSLLFRAIEYGIADYCKEKNVGILAYSPLAQGLLTGKFKTAADVSDERARLRFYSSKRSGTVHSEAGAEEEIFAALKKMEDLCKEASIPMGNAAIAWVLNKPEVSAVIAGARNPQQMKRNAEAMNIRLSAEMIENLSTITEPVKAKLGSNADMWRTVSRVS